MPTEQHPPAAGIDALRRLGMLSYGTTCSIVLMLPLWLVGWPALSGSPVYLSQQTRMLLLLIGLVPAACFVVLHYLAEARYPLARLAPLTALRSLITLSLLLTPSALVVLRFSEARAIVNAVALAAAVAVLLGPPRLFEESPYALILGHARAVMVDSLQQELSTRSSALQLAPGRLHQYRRDFYVGIDRVRTFQQTLSCRWTDAEAAESLLNGRLPLSAASVVDGVRRPGDHAG